MAHVNVNDFGNQPTGNPEGGTVTSARTSMFDFIGGPADGCAMPVEVDRHGVPVEITTISDITHPNARINPMSGPQSNIVNATYERRPHLGPDGVGYAFHFVDEAVDNTSGPIAA